MPLRTEDVAKVIPLIDDGRSLRYVAATIRTPYSTVRDAVERFRETHSYCRKPGSSRKRKTTARDDRLLVLQILRTRHTTVVEA
ncbi:hypothetical protein C0J52_16208 [Blattella germanica]|nr:hypothetical protein C0J52_16208 [Blattella germanica]